MNYGSYLDATFLCLLPSFVSGADLFLDCWVVSGYRVRLTVECGCCREFFAFIFVVSIF